MRGQAGQIIEANDGDPGFSVGAMENDGHVIAGVGYSLRDGLPQAKRLATLDLEVHSLDRRANVRRPSRPNEVPLRGFLPE